MRTPLRQIRKSALRYFEGRPLPAAPAEFPAALEAAAQDLVDRRFQVDDLEAQVLAA